MVERIRVRSTAVESGHRALHMPVSQPHTDINYTTKEATNNVIPAIVQNIKGRISKLNKTQLIILIIMVFTKNILLYTVLLLFPGHRKYYKKVDLTQCNINIENTLILYITSLDI